MEPVCVDSGGITLSVEPVCVDSGGITLSVQPFGIDLGGIILSKEPVGIVPSVDSDGITLSVQPAGIVSSVHSPAILFASGESEFGSALLAHSAGVVFTVDAPPVILEHMNDEDSELVWCVVWLSMGSAVTRLVDGQSVDSGLVMLVDSAEVTLSVDSVLMDGDGDGCLFEDSMFLVAVSFAEWQSELSTLVVEHCILVSLVG